VIHEQNGEGMAEEKESSVEHRSGSMWMMNRMPNLNEQGYN
jgi:hypothetical protein